MKLVLTLCGITALAAAGGCACGDRCGQTRVERTNQCRTEKVTQVTKVTAPEPCTDPMIGERGPDGPAGSVGERGPTGQTGPPGHAVAGLRGEAGPKGSAGEQGQTGATGAAGTIVRGRTGAQGAAGDAGQQGPGGQTGARGDSALGQAGPIGAQGPAGPAGATGATGARGAALEGPTGPTGRSGPAGAQGAIGYTGAQGSTTPGIAGPAGPAGARGPQGPTGAMGEQGRVGVVACWTSYRDFWFQNESADLQTSEMDRFEEIATYMNRNPSLQLGIDASVEPRGTNGHDQGLADRRVKSIHDALVKAGVPTHKISVGSYGDVELRRDRRVELLIATAAQ